MQILCSFILAHGDAGRGAQVYSLFMEYGYIFLIFAMTFFSCVLIGFVKLPTGNIDIIVWY